MSNPLGWRAAVICGLLWGLSVTLADTLTQPIVGLTPGQWLYFTLGLLWQWTVVGLAWTIGAKLLAHGRWVFAKLIVLLAFSWAVSVCLQWISPFAISQGPDALSMPLAGTIPIFDLAIYLLWMNAFYGSLYVAGYLATLRTARASRRLTEFRLARNRADILIREARVSAFRGQLQPSILLTAIAALRERYARDPIGGDQLFDSLIAFLRVAMPSIRSGISTLAAELETVRNYAELRAMLPVVGPNWRLDWPAILPALPFPSLVLLPAMHSLGAALRAQDWLTLSVAVAPDAVVLRLAADQAARLPQQIDQRLRGGLRLTLGPAARVSEGRDLPMTIELLPQFEAVNAAYFDHDLDGGTNETDGIDGDRSALGFYSHSAR